MAWLNLSKTQEKSIKILSNGSIYNEKLIAYKRYIENTLKTTLKFEKTAF